MKYVFYWCKRIVIINKHRLILYLQDMDIINKILTLIILGMALQACKDCVPKPIKIPEEVGFSIYPERREYHVGDTIYFSSSTDENIFPTGYDLNSDEIVSQIS